MPPRFPPMGLELTGIRACSPAGSACPWSACCLSRCALPSCAWDDGSSKSPSTFRSRPAACALRPPALSPALATSCEAARRASCAKARGEGEGWPAAKGIAALPPGLVPCIPEPEGAERTAT